MYCPRCATQNLDDAKFCRACGTNLEAVALALSDKERPARPKKGKTKEPEPEKSWAEKRSEAVKDIVEGGGLLAASVLIGVALGLFSNQPDWIFVWLIFVGWLACWGVISMVSGIGSFLEARLMLGQLEPTTHQAIDAKAELASVDEQRLLPEPLPASNLHAPLSVTEHTTEPLVKHQQRSKPAG